MNDLGIAEVEKLTTSYSSNNSRLEELNRKKKVIEGDITKMNNNSTTNIPRYTNQLQGQLRNIDEEIKKLTTENLDIVTQLSKVQIPLTVSQKEEDDISEVGDDEGNSISSDIDRDNSEVDNNDEGYLAPQNNNSDDDDDDDIILGSRTRGPTRKHRKHKQTHKHTHTKSPTDLTKTKKERKKSLNLQNMKTNVEKICKKIDSKYINSELDKIKKPRYDENSKIEKRETVFKTVFENLAKLEEKVQLLNEYQQRVKKENDAVDDKITELNRTKNANKKSIQEFYDLSHDISSTVCKSPYFSRWSKRKTFKCPSRLQRISNFLGRTRRQYLHP